MRLLMTTDTVGGVWTFSCELTEGLIASGCHTALISLGPPPSPDQQSWLQRQATRHPDLFQHHHINAPLEWQQNNALACTSATPALQAIVSAFKPDIALSSQFCFGDFPFDIPSIVIAHSDVLSWAQAVGEAPLPASAWLETYIELVRNGLGHARAVVAPTHWMLDVLDHNFVLPGHIRVIANGRNLPGIADDPESDASATPRKLQGITAGRLWDPAKGVSILRGLHSPMPLLVAGDNTLDGSARNDYFANIIFLGKLGEAEILARFSESSVYLCTSLYEPFGLAPLEAALCGCAVIARDIPSLREVWGTAALYFRSATDLSALLDRLSSDPAALAVARRAAREKAAFYTRERMADAYLALCRELLAADPERADAA